MSTKDVAKRDPESPFDFGFSGNSKVRKMKRDWLAGYLQTGTLTGACQWSGIVIRSGKHKGKPQPMYHQKWLGRGYYKDHPHFDPEFVRAFEVVQEQWRDNLREHWHERAFGYEEEVVLPSGQVVTRRSYSERLLKHLIDCTLPEGAKPQGVAVNVHNDNRQQHQHVHLDGMTIHQKRFLLQAVKLEKLEAEPRDRVFKQLVALSGLAEALAAVEAGQAVELGDGAKRLLVRLVREYLTPEDAARLLPPPPPPVIEHAPAPEPRPEPTRPGNLVDFPRQPE